MPLPPPGIIDEIPSNSEGETPSEPETEGEASAAPEQQPEPLPEENTPSQPEALPEDEPAAQPEAELEVPMAEPAPVDPAQVDEVCQIVSKDGSTSTSYATLMEAVDAVKNDETIRLLKAAMFTQYTTDTSKYPWYCDLPAGKIFTIDLNGQTLSSDTSSDESTKCTKGVRIYGTVTIKDTSDGGTIHFPKGATGFDVKKGGALILEGGSLEAASSPAIRVSGGTYTQEGGNVQTGGKNGVQVASGTATFDGGSVSAKEIDIYLLGVGTVKIMNPNVISPELGGKQANIKNNTAGTVIIGNETSVEGTSSYYIPAIIAGSGKWVFHEGIIGKTVYNQKFSADSKFGCFFEIDVSQNLPAGFDCQAVPVEGKTYYQVSRLTAEKAGARIGPDTYYASAAVAAAALQKGETLTLLKDYTADSPLTIKVPEVTLDLNGCSITNTSTSENAFGLSLEPIYKNMKADSAIHVVGEGTITATIPLNLESGNSNYTLGVTLADTVSLHATGSVGTINMGTSAYMLSSPAVLEGINGGFGAVVNGEKRVYGTYSTAAKDSGTHSATLLKSYTGTEPIALNSAGNWTLDLAGNTYTVTNTDSAIKVDGNANIHIKNGIVQLKNAKSADNAAAGAYVEDNCAMTLEKIDLLSDGTYGIITHGTQENINIKLIGGSITAPADGAGIYFPSANSKLTIDGTAITAGTGLAVKGGTVTVKDGSSIYAIGDALTPNSPSGSGYNGEGDAIYLEGNYDRDVSIILEGGIFSSKNGKAIQMLFVTGGGDKSIAILGGYYDGGLNGEVGKLKVSDGAFSNDPSNYVTEGFIAISQKEVKDGITYHYAIAKSNADLIVDVQTGKSEVTINGDLTAEEKIAAQAAAESLKATEGLNGLGGNIALNPGISEQEAISALKNSGVAVTEADTPVLVVQPYLEIIVKDYDPSTNHSVLKMDITPKYNLLATLDSKNMVTGSIGKNTVTIKSSLPLEVRDGERVEIQLKLPAGFTTDHLYAKHSKQDGRIYYYPVSVREDSASFSVLHGFSLFELRSDSRTGKLEFHLPQGGNEVKEYVPADVGSLLPPVSKIGQSFLGWQIDGMVYTELTDDLLTKLSLAGGVAVTADPVFSKPNSTSDGGKSFAQRNSDFWEEVRQSIEDAKDGDVIKVNAKNYDRMSWTVMRELERNEGVSLVIRWNGGEEIVIPAGKAQSSESTRIYWPLSMLEELYAEASLTDPETGKPTTPDKVNPSTGGVLEIIAPDSPAGEEIQVADAHSGLAATDSADPLAEPETAPVSAGLPTEALIGFAVAAAAAAVGFLLWKKRV